MKKKLSLALLFLPFVSFMTFAQSSEIKQTRITYSGSSTQALLSPLSSNATNTGDDERQWFNNFYVGLGALGDKGVAELGVTLRRFELYLGTIKTTIKIKDENNSETDETKERDITIGFNFLNRASINFDSLKYIANNYLLSLNPSPFTLRIDHSLYITDNEVIEIGKKCKPVVGFRLQIDGRAVPFAGQGGSVDVGGSLNLFGTLFVYTKSYEIQGSQVKDEGTFYIEPTFYFITATNSLMQSMLIDKNQKFITGLDFKIGFKSEKNSINDIGLSGFYTWNKVEGPKFKVGLSIKPK